MRSNRSSRFSAFLVITAILLLSWVGLALAQEGEAQAIGWLKDHRKAVRPDEIVVSGTLFTIIPSSHRMVVKSGNPEKTLVLGFADDVEVGDGKDSMNAADLQRGDQLVVILRRNVMARAIYKAK
jgi:hypothetical protein